MNTIIPVMISIAVIFVVVMFAIAFVATSSINESLRAILTSKQAMVNSNLHPDFAYALKRLTVISIDKYSRQSQVELNTIEIAGNPLPTGQFTITNSCQLHVSLFHISHAGNPYSTFFKQDIPHSTFPETKNLFPRFSTPRFSLKSQEIFFFRFRKSANFIFPMPLDSELWDKNS